MDLEASNSMCASKIRSSQQSSLYLVNEGSFEFEFSAHFDLGLLSPSLRSADELFLNGKIHPMKLSPLPDLNAGDPNSKSEIKSLSSEEKPDADNSTPSVSVLPSRSSSVLASATVGRDGGNSSIGNPNNSSCLVFDGNAGNVRTEGSNWAKSPLNLKIGPRSVATQNRRAHEKNVPD